MTELDAFLDGYITAALWSSTGATPPFTCPDCGRPITLNPTGWWSHDGLPGDCWRVPMDGPEDEPLDANYSREDLAPEALTQMGADVARFVALNRADLDAYCEQVGPWTGTDSRGYIENESPWARAGHDFWLTRNGHGAGFWDRDLGDLGNRLSDAARASGGSDLYIGDDRKLYVA